MSNYRVEVLHDVAQRKFVINLSESEQAYLSYRLDESSQSVDFVSTFVPPSLRGGGLAAQLVDVGFAWADAAGLSITASCWYADRALQRRTRGG